MKRMAASAPALRVVVGGAASPQREPAVPPVAAEPLTDDALVEALRAGNAAACTELHDRLAPTVDATLYRVLGARGPDFDDLVQTSFEQIWRTLVQDRFAGACSLKSWARSIATHLGLNALRARQRERKVFDRTAPPELDGPTHLDPERHAAARRELARVREHLAALTPDRAVALVLHDALGHDLAEIAVLTGVSVSAAQSRLVRGRKDFAALVERDALQGDRR